MRKDIAGPEAESTMPMWEGLEGVVREKAQEFIQQILEEEVTELLGREKSERKAAVDAAPGYRNGYGKARRLSMSSGTITVRRPRVRGLEFATGEKDARPADQLKAIDIAARYGLPKEAYDEDLIFALMDATVAMLPDDPELVVRIKKAWVLILAAKMAGG